MEDQEQAVADLRARRQELADAVNAHDVEAIKQFVDRSYRARSRQGIGITLGYDDILQQAELSFKWSKGFRETVEIEAIELHHDTAEMTTSRHDSYTLLWFLQKRGDTRQVETWKLIDGRWMIVGEELLEIREHLSLGRATE